MGGGGVYSRIDKHLIQGGAIIPLGVSSNVTESGLSPPFPSGLSCVEIILSL